MCETCDNRKFLQLAIKANKVCTLLSYFKDCVRETLCDVNSRSDLYDREYMKKKFHTDVSMKARQWCVYLKCIECDCKQCGVSKVHDKLMGENPSVLSDKQKKIRFNRWVQGANNRLGPKWLEKMKKELDMYLQDCNAHVCIRLEV